jgi:hypothetical protein
MLVLLKYASNCLTALKNKYEHKLNCFQNLDIDFQGVWFSTASIFDYDTQMSKSAAARAFAKEQWSSQYFQDLEKYRL